jgi:hypothetical protein
VGAGGLVATFEFDSNGATTPGNIPIRFDSIDFATDDANNPALSFTDQIIAQIAGAGLGLFPQRLGGGRIQLQRITLPRTAVESLDTSASSLTQSGQEGVQPNLRLQVPSAGGAAVGGVRDGNTFTISNGTQTVQFEFDSNGIVFAGNTAVPFDSVSTADEIANSIVAALRNSNLGLRNPTNLGNGLVDIGATPIHTLTVGPGPLQSLGVAGGAVPIPFEPSETFDLAAAIAAAVNAKVAADAAAGLPASEALNGVVARVGAGGTVDLIGAASVGPIGGTLVSGITDIAGNPLTPNRADGTTQFTIIHQGNPFQNPASDLQNDPPNDPQFDVDDDRDVDANDALLIIGRLRQFGSMTLPPVLPADSPVSSLPDTVAGPGIGNGFGYVDVSGDGAMTPLDAIQVISFLRRQPVMVMTLAGGEGEGDGAYAITWGAEGEAASPAVSSDSAMMNTPPATDVAVSSGQQSDSLGNSVVLASIQAPIAFGSFSSPVPVREEAEDAAEALDSQLAGSSVDLGVAPPLSAVGLETILEEIAGDISIAWRKKPTPQPALDDSLENAPWWETTGAP